MTDFATAVAHGYAAAGPALELGRGVHEGRLVTEAAVRIPLAMMNRHGLVAGAAGTGKTTTLQGLAEGLSAAGVSVVVADLKGDLSGLGAAGEPGGPGEKRMAELGLPFAPRAFLVEYLSLGRLSKATVGVLLRALVGLESGGGTELFGEPQFAIADLLRTAAGGRGVISCVELPAVRDKPRLFSTALMWLVAELFEQLPEVGDRDRPKLVFFFDEAHLLFDGATPAFVDSVAQTVRLIRSKGVGVFFVTQTPRDVPADVLGQLGSRIQHALRAFTPEDEKALRATVHTLPKSEHDDLAELLTSMGSARPR